MSKMQPETISPVENELLNQTLAEGEKEGVTDVIVNPDFGDDPHVETDGQVSMYPNEARSASRRNDVTQGFKSVEARIKRVKEHATFFKSFAAFVSELDVDPDRETIRENVKTALVRAASLQEDLEWALAQYKKIEELEELIAESDNAERPEPKPHPTIDMNPDNGDEDEEESEEDQE